MRIDRRWHQLCGVHKGAPMGNPLDCNVFAFETGHGAIIFDAGCGRTMDGLTSAIAEIGTHPTDLFITHAHVDHSGGAAAIKSRYGAEIHAGALTSEWLAAGDEAKTSLNVAKAAGIYPPNYHLVPARVDDVLRDGDRRRVGDAVVTAIATPGHSADHFCFLVETDGDASLVAGDAIFAGGKIILQNTWDSSVPDSCASVRKLSGFTFGRLVAGHGPPLLSEAHLAIETALERINRLLPPANLL